MHISNTYSKKVGFVSGLLVIFFRTASLKYWDVVICKLKAYASELALLQKGTQRMEVQ